MDMATGSLGKAIQVLIVDDDADWVSECAFMLGELGYQPVCALSGEEALELAQGSGISLVIVDYNMPGCDGVALIQQLLARAAEEGRQMRFIMATAHATMDVAVAAMRASAVDFLQKPVAPQELCQALQRVSGLDQSQPARSALLHKLSSLSSELQRLSSLIDESGTPAAPRTEAPAGGERVTADFIRLQLQSEAKRRALGGGALFGDPAWYMLLDLLLAKLEGRTVSVSSACIASGAPTTTALRLIKRLVNDDILRRIPDERDGRRDFLIINGEVEELLLRYLAEQARR